MTRYISILVLLTSIKSLNCARETVLLINDKPLDIEWNNCISAESCLQTNVIDKVADLENKVKNITFGDYLEEDGTFINLSSRIKMKMIQKDNGKIAFRFVANNSPAESSRGHMRDNQHIKMIAFAMMLFVLGTISTTVKVNVFLALLAVAVGKVILFFVYTASILHKYKHHHGSDGIHIHKAPVYHYKHTPVQVLEQAPEYHHEHSYVDYHDHHDHHHYDQDHHHDHHDHHDDWLIKKKK